MASTAGTTIYLGALALIPIGVVLLLSPLSEPSVRQKIAPVLILCGCGCMIWGWQLGKRAVLVCEEGIVQGQIRLSFDRVDLLQVELLQILVEGLPSMEYRFNIVGTTSSGLQVVDFRWGNLGAKFTRAEDLIDRICPHIEKRMLQQMRDGQEVEWAAGWQIGVDGLLSDRRVLLPYSQVQRFEISDGRLIVETTTNRLELSAAEPNFFPGYRLVTALLSNS